MPSRDDPRVVVRLSAELHGRLVAVAGERGKAAFVRGALENELAAAAPVVSPSVGRLVGENVVVNGRGEIVRADPSKPATVSAAFRCPAGHGVVAGAGPRGRCFCNRPVVPA